MVKRFIVFALAALLFSCTTHKERVPAEDFIRIEGQNLVRHGERFFIRGTNLGNWLNPEGYMFGFRKTNSASWIDRMFRELAGPDFTDEFWKNFKDRYITHADIAFIASTGANTIRLPFHYKLFTEEDYMGLTTAQDGFDRIDSVVAWCRREGLYVILDMHDAPGGQTGDNIDDSHGYPWLFESPVSEQLFYDIWVRIADRYKNEPVILGYDLLNEPIAPYFSNKDSLNTMLEPLYKRAVARIRQVDTNHIVILGAPQWNSNFDPFTDWSFDDKIIYSCHRYGGDATAEAIAHFIEFRNKTDLPMYMGEIGHNTPEWMKAFCKVMEDNNIGYTFWPYKKMGGSCFVSVGTPENWDQVVAFSEAPRDTYAAIREARPDQELIRLAMTRFLELCLFENCRIEEDYIRALCLDKERTDN
ncbi:MAG TPA: glycoside hydrolase family 5 protein [Bacteroidales bacterium]|nr:glycoside hydrolase family 5 protein [Bacteroidales bacterium]